MSYRCCDLLSIYYLWHTENNALRAITKRLTVVICFQSIIFDILKTTCFFCSWRKNALWFAFNLLSLTYWKQPTYSLICNLFGCDLLSIYYLWHTENNRLDKKCDVESVVICFQSIIFDILKTTIDHNMDMRRQLWFAFNLLSLTYWKQL